VTSCGSSKVFTFCCPARNLQYAKKKVSGNDGSGVVDAQNEAVTTKLDWQLQVLDCRGGFLFRFVVESIESDVAF
jgi:hypothetical protein